MHERELQIRGTWRDRIEYPDGSEGSRHGELRFGHNQIQNVCARLVCSLLKLDTAYAGITYLAVGEGVVGWDSEPPTIDYEQADLTTEIYRKAILPASMIYVDPDTGDPSGTPTSRLEISCVLLPGEGTGTLREFALFGGTATGAADSGEMLNHVVHAKIEKVAGMRIERTIWLEFQTR